MMNTREMMRIQKIMEDNKTVVGGKEKKRCISNYTNFHYSESENFEYDEDCLMNYSGCEDEVFNAFSEHEDWQEGYDY